MKKRIHINRHVIARNGRTGEREPVIVIKTYKENHYAHNCEIMGNSSVVYSPDKPLKCGAKLWIETEAPVVTESGTI